MKIWSKVLGLGLVACLAVSPASAQDLNPNQFGLGDIVSILGGNRGGGYGYDQGRGGFDVSDLIGIASVIYQTTQQNRQPYYYPQPGYYPNQYPAPNQYPYQYPNNHPQQYPYQHQQYPYQQPQYYPPQNPYYR